MEQNTNFVFFSVIEKQKDKAPLINLKQWPKFKLYVKDFLDRVLRKRRI